MVYERDFRTRSKRGQVAFIICASWSVNGKCSSPQQTFLSSLQCLEGLELSSEIGSEPESMERTPVLSPLCQTKESLPIESKPQVDPKRLSAGSKSKWRSSKAVVILIVFLIIVIVHQGLVYFKT